MIVTWYGVDGATYDVARSDDVGVTWTTVASDIATATYTDTEGSTISYYRVRVHGSTIWNPMFAGTVETTPTSCLVHGTIRDVFGVLFNGANVFFQVPQQRQFVTDAFYVNEEPLSTVTDNNGYWSKSLPVGLYVNIRIPAAKIDESVTIPALSTVDFASLL